MYMYMCTIILLHGAPAVGKSSLDHSLQGLLPKDTKMHLKSLVLEKNLNTFQHICISICICNTHSRQKVFLYTIMKEKIQ